MVTPRNWRPGSFTKNFAWGKSDSGLGHLHEAIHVAFDGKPDYVERELARTRLRNAGINDLIPPNFFLFNVRDGVSQIVPDELVRIALSIPAGKYFDRLSVFALNLSLAGNWNGASPEQRYPAEWAKHYIVNRVFSSGRWDGSRISSADIQEFIVSNEAYQGVWAGKVSSNLNYIYELSGIRKLSSGLAENWWGSAVVLALERISADRAYSKPWPTTEQILKVLVEEHVFELTAVPIDEGMIAAREIIEAYFDSPTNVTTSSPTTSIREANLQSAKSKLPVQRVYASASRQVRDRSVVRTIRNLYQDKCSICGEALALLDDGTYAEVGHIKPVGLPFRGPDHISNVLPFCPNHHRQFDNGAICFSVLENQITVIDRSSTSAMNGRTFSPAKDHALDLSNLSWHADYFLQR